MIYFPTQNPKKVFVHVAVAVDVAVTLTVLETDVADVTVAN